MNPQFNITSHDGIWSTNLAPSKDVILGLIQDPAKFIASLPNLSDIEFPEGRITILFEYGRAPGKEFVVHGVSRTSLITVRAPRVGDLGEGGVHPDFLAQSSTTLQVARRTDINMAYVHYDPVVTDNTVAYEEIANLIAHPASLPIWLAPKKFDPDPHLIGSDGSLTADTVATSYTYTPLSERFTLVYQTSDSNPPKCPPPCTLVQCIKSAGEYTLTGSTLSLTIDEALVVLWCDCPA